MGPLYGPNTRELAFIAHKTWQGARALFVSY